MHRRKIKIIHVIGSFQIGGAENQVVQLLNNLDNTIFEKHVGFFKNSETHLWKKLNPEIKKHYIPLRRWGQIACIARLTALFRVIRPHVVQSHMFHTNLYTAIAARIANVPVIITTEHGKNLWKNILHHLIERWIISPLSTRRIAVSQDIKTIRQKTGDIPENKITVIPPCVSIPEKKVVPNEKPPMHIGAIGRMVQAKDYPTLLQAFARVIQDGISAQLIFLGDGPERSNLEHITHELGINKSVSFPGFQSNVEKWLGSMDIVVFSSIREGIPVAMLEAMAKGIPIISTRAGGIPEVIRDGIEGLLVDIGAHIALANAIKQLAQHIQLRKTYGTRGRERVATLYSCEVISQRYEMLYQKLLQDRGFHDWQ